MRGQKQAIAHPRTAPETGMMVMEMFDAVKREWTAINVLLRAKKWLDPVTNESADLLADDLEAAVDRHQGRVAFRFEDRQMSYGELDAMANRVAHWALSEGLAAGDCAAIFMENRPEYVAAWFGLTKIGVIPALINSNLSGEGLAHCINIAGAKTVITGEEQDAQVESAKPFLTGAPSVWSLGGSAGEDLAADLDHHSSDRPSRELRAHLTNRDICFYLYTSGTTGLPKAAKMSHARVRSMMRTFISPCNTTAKDKVYVTLPLYHATGGLCGVGIALYTGAEVILRRKFSASHFWEDCVRHGVTTFVYIGELCRYLINQPESAMERAHKVRCGFGNGLRMDIWDDFRTRFGVGKMIEFYGSTESNVKLMNFDGTPGACGRIPPYAAKHFDHIAFVRYDVETGQPLRGEDGLCQRAAMGEPGEAIGRIGEDARTRIEGYNDPKDTEAKVLRDVFEKGDMWFRTGDLMRQGAHGYVYFVDRLGDTFRWKGENVSTNEVAEALSQVPGVETANVYGVTVPGTEGKAGMASVTVSGYLDYKDLFDRLSARLPKYAVPVFIREQQQAETTGTFKYRKVDLAKQGFDPEAVEDPVWYHDPETGEYVRLTPEEFRKIGNGGVRF
ncbi:long-chain-acyl-CoA synthetase [Henriciella mobilis]|nr:long-chain-acyl-CoA synthetase [Henriciella mobilis]